LPPDALTAFFSYSRDDSEFALRLAKDLKAAGADVWLDQLDLVPGQRWARTLQEALQSSPRILVVLSPASVDSTNVEDEVNFALDEQKTVIPVFYKDCKIPFRLRPLQYVDFRKDYAHGLKVMLKTLGVRASLPTATHPEHERRGSASKQPLSRMAYAGITLVGLLFALGFTFFYVYQVPKLVEGGGQGRVFYLLLVPWALSSAVFLFGAIRSYLTRRLGSFLELGGPVVLFCLVLVGGFKLFAMELEKAHPTFVQKATLVPPPVKGKTVQIRVDGQKIDAAIDELGGFTFTASGKAGDRLLVEVFVNQKLASSGYYVVGTHTIDIHWTSPQ